MMAGEQRRARDDTNEDGAVRSQSDVDTAALMDQFCRSLVKAVKEVHEENASLPAARAEEESAAREWAYTVDLVEFLFRILINLKYILLTAILCAALAGLYTRYFVAPVYSARAKLYVLSQEDAAIKLSDLQIGSSLTMDFQEVFKTWEVHELVRAKLGLHYSYSQLQSMLSVSNPANTRVLYITVKGVDPKEAAAIANAYAEAAKAFILEMMRMEEPSFFSIALVPDGVIGPSPLKNIVSGFLIGACAVIGVVFLRLLMDDKPRTPEDISRCAGIPTLAVVPGPSAKGAAARRLPRTYGKESAG